MINALRKYLNASVLFGVLGILVAGWGAYSYLKAYGIIGSKPAPVQITSDYSPVGQVSAVKNVPETTPQVINTSSTQKNNTSTTKGPLMLPFITPPFSGADWIYDWGNASITNGALTFGASTSSTGGDLFLASSTAWTNYEVKANVNWLAGESFGIIARFVDSKNFVYCNFASKTNQIIVRMNGNDVVLASADTSDNRAGTKQKFGIAVFGNNVGCTVNDGEVVGASMVGNRLASGGIGLISWDKTPGVSKIFLQSLTVMPLSLNNILVPFPVVATTSTAMIDPATSSSSTPAVIPTPPAKVKLPYAIDNFSSDVNWQRTWGVMSVDDSHFLKVMSAADTSGGEVILGNTNDWIDYGMTATLDWVKGQTFMIIGRYQDPNNYVGCNFVKDSNAPGAVLIQLKKYVNGNGATIQTGEDFNFSQEGGSDVKVSLILQDSQATCSFNGHTISNTGGNSYGVSPFPGTIGFTTWDPAHNNTELTIKKVSVSANY